MFGLYRLNYQRFLTLRILTKIQFKRIPVIQCSDKTGLTVYNKGEFWAHHDKTSAS